MQQHDTINSIVVIDSENGAHFAYDGPFGFNRHGGKFTVPIPLDQDDYASIHPETAEGLTEREGDLALTITDGEAHASGTIDSAAIVEDELLIRVDDPTHVSTDEIDVDTEELRS